MLILKGMGQTSAVGLSLGVIRRLRKLAFVALAIVLFVTEKKGDSQVNKEPYGARLSSRHSHPDRATPEIRILGLTPLERTLLAASQAGSRTSSSSVMTGAGGASSWQLVERQTFSRAGNPAGVRSLVAARRVPGRRAASKADSGSWKTGSSAPPMSWNGPPPVRSPPSAGTLSSSTAEGRGPGRLLRRARACLGGTFSRLAGSVLAGRGFHRPRPRSDGRDLPSLNSPRRRGRRRLLRIRQIGRGFHGGPDAISSAPPASPPTVFSRGTSTVRSPRS